MSGPMWLILIAGCASNQLDTGDNPLPGPVLTETGTEATVGSDRGHVTLLTLPEQVGVPAQNLLAGVFVEADRGWDNLAQCLSRPGTYCAQNFPTAIDDWEPLDAYQESIPQSLLTRAVGSFIELGPFRAEYLLDEEQGLDIYFQDLGEVKDVPESLSLHIPGGVWPEIELEQVVTMPSPMRVLEPDPLQAHYFHNAHPVTFRWVPGEQGDVYLAMVSFTTSRLYRLEDDGEFELDLAALGLFDFEAVTFALGRWSRVEVPTPGGTLHVTVQSDQYLHGYNREIGDRTKILAPDTCDEAMAAPSLEPGSYWGDTREHHNSLNPGKFGCTGFNAGAQDGIIPVDLAPAEYIELTYQLPQDDASVYFVEDCSTAGTCLVGADATLGSGPEVLSFYNDQDTEQRIYLVVDAYQYPLTPSVTDVFYLDVEMTEILGDVLVNDCAEAMASTTLQTGSYEGSLGGHINRLDPEDSPSCGTAAPGGEGIAKVTLNPGETISVEVQMPDADPILYWTWACNLVDSCIDLVNLDNSTVETLTWTNDTPFQENRYLIVDSAAGATTYYLSVVTD